MTLKEYKSGVIVVGKVTSHASRWEVGWNGKELLLSVKRPSLKGPVNQEILDNLKGFFAREVHMLQGHKSQRKILWIEGTSKKELLLRLEGLPSKPVYPPSLRDPSKRMPRTRKPRH